MARECASPWDMLGKGKGKGGGKGEAKGGKVGGQWYKGGDYKGGKGWPKGAEGKKGGWNMGGQAQKGKGKGYQGYCYDCGQQGHKRGEAACPMASQPMDLGAVGKVEEEGGAALEFGGGAVWQIAQIGVEKEKPEVEAEWKTVISKKQRRRWKPSNRGGEGEETGLKEVRIEEDRIVCEIEEKFIGAAMKDSEAMAMNFQVAGVKKALAAVSRICKAGNTVQFGESEAECFIKNKVTGRSS